MRAKRKDKGGMKRREEEKTKSEDEQDVGEQTRRFSVEKIRPDACQSRTRPRSDRTLANKEFVSTSVVYFIVVERTSLSARSRSMWSLFFNW
jgi:hypothetical protein